MDTGTDTVSRLDHIVSELIELAQVVPEGDESDDLYTAAAAVDTVAWRLAGGGSRRSAAGWRFAAGRGGNDCGMWWRQVVAVGITAVAAVAVWQWSVWLESPGPALPDVRGMDTAVAHAKLEDAGIDDFEFVDGPLQSGDQVCAQQPSPGVGTRGPVKLYVNCDKSAKDDARVEAEDERRVRRQDERRVRRRAARRAEEATLLRYANQLCAELDAGMNSPDYTREELEAVAGVSC
jgi:hypothetical protein